MSDILDLLNFKNDLQAKISLLDLTGDINEKVCLFDTIKDQDLAQNYAEDFAKADQNFQNLYRENQNILNQINDLVSKIELDIDALANEKYNNNDTYRNNLSEEHMIQLTASNEAIDSIIRSNVSRYADFHYPGLQFCRYFTEKSYQNKDSIKHYTPARILLDSMVACDPLYLVNRDLDELTDIIKIYPEAYQRRLRLYKDLTTLPQNQFGLILCWDYFNYITADKIEFYLREFIKLLRPGGTVMFSYNECNYPHAIKLVEEGKASWMCDRTIRKLFQEIGFETISFESLPVDNAENTKVSWVEARKPGELRTSKLIQSQGQVLRK